MPTGTGIFIVDVIDMTLEEPDVVGTVHLVAANPEDAKNKALNFLHGQGITKTESEDPNARYHINIVLIGPMPQAMKSIVAVSGAEAQAILKSGEIAPRIPKR